MKKNALLILEVVLATSLALVLVSGCKESGPTKKIFVRKDTRQRMRIAVLPFDNVSRDQEAGRVVTNTVITYLLSTGAFDVVEPGVVYDALGAETIRLTEGITIDACQKLQPRLNADAFIIGLVEEFGEVRIGPESYPSISFSARLVDARTAEILWAATISKTGAEGVKIFDIGRVSSLGKLAKSAVKSMAESLANSRELIMAGMMGATVQPRVEQVGGTGQAAPSATTAAVHGPGQSTAGHMKYLDESAVYGENEIRALLKDVGTAKLGDITYKKHFHDSVETKYQIGDSRFVEVRLVDYVKAATAEKFLKHYHPGEQGTTFESLPAVTGESEFSYYHLDVAVGRFGLFLRGPKDRKADIDALGKGIIELLK